MTVVTERTDLATSTRTEIVRPAMCGHNSLFAGRVGDWTWDAVSAACGTDVLTARDAAGSPTYLSFYYYRIRGGRRFHLRTPAFGDRLAITSRVFGFGSESVLTLHRIGRNTGAPEPVLDPDDFYTAGDDGNLYVENFNRWITRSKPGSNSGLLRGSPAGFRHEHLPVLPDRYSPRALAHRARKERTFVTPQAAATGTEAHTSAAYVVDASRDLNGVGLLYFASYFSIVDWALLGWWREQGRTDASYLDRIVADQQLCFLGNADAGSVLTAEVRRRRPSGPTDTETLDVVLTASGRLLAVCTLHLLSGGPS